MAIQDVVNIDKNTFDNAQITVDKISDLLSDAVGLAAGLPQNDLVSKQILIFAKIVGAARSKAGCLKFAYGLPPEGDFPAQPECHV